MHRYQTSMDIEQFNSYKLILPRPPKNNNNHIQKNTVTCTKCIRETVSPIRIAASKTSFIVRVQGETDDFYDSEIFAPTCSVISDIWSMAALNRGSSKRMTADDSDKLKEQRREYTFQYKYSDIHQMAKNIRHDCWYIHVWRTHTSTNIQPYTPKHHTFTTRIHNLQNRPPKKKNSPFSIYNVRTNTTTHTHPTPYLRHTIYNTHAPPDPHTHACTHTHTP